MTAMWGSLTSRYKCSASHSLTTGKKAQTLREEGLPALGTRAPYLSTFAKIVHR